MSRKSAADREKEELTAMALVRTRGCERECKGVGKHSLARADTHAVGPAHAKSGGAVGGHGTEWKARPGPET